MKVLAISAVLVMGGLLLTVPAMSTAADDKNKEPDKTIKITGDDSKAKYIEVGKTEQEPVEVVVGQTVRWHNKSNVAHTATSDLKVEDKAVFDTDSIDPEESKDIVFTKELYEKAGGKPGGMVKLHYHCTPHPKTMQSDIILKAAP